MQHEQNPHNQGSAHLVKNQELSLHLAGTQVWSLEKGN
jgi:hypothetical protein